MRSQAVTEVSQDIPEEGAWGKKDSQCEDLSLRPQMWGTTQPKETRTTAASGRAECWAI